ncbi:hypothetical protein ACROYT_G037024 [Oculina patagonica]
MKKDQERLRIFTFEKCIQDCKQGSSKDDHASPKLRMQRSIKENQRCLGLSDPIAAFPHRAERLKVEFKSIEADKHSYKIFWKPLKEFLFDEYNWTHYSLLYFFENNPSPDGKTSCVLVPRNVTSWTITDHAPNIKPDVLHFAVVSFPFKGTNTGNNIWFDEYDPLRPTFIPTFIPVFETIESATRPMSIAWAPIAGGSAAGVVLLVILLMGIMWRRRSALCPSNYQDPGMQAVISRPNNIKERVTDRTAVAASSSADNSCELYYSCYFPENEAFRGKVASIVNFFRKNGYDVIMDAMVSSELSSQGPTRWAENQIRKAKKVLVFLSPGLLKLASSADGCEGTQSQDINRVWMELEVLRDLYTQNRSAAKMVCITFPDLPVTSQDVPVWLKVSYKWPGDVREILKRLNDRPSIKPFQ